LPGSPIMTADIRVQDACACLGWACAFLKKDHWCAAEASQRAVLLLHMQLDQAVLRDEAMLSRAHKEGKRRG
jgi:hypothetical protein